MNELQKQVNHELHELVKKLMTRIKKGEEEGGIDLSDFIIDLSNTDQKMNELFDQARKRTEGKKGFFR